MSVLTTRLCKVRLMMSMTQRLYSTVDESEIKHHNQFTHVWWDKSGPMKALHSMNDLRVQFIRTGLINAKMLKKEDCNAPKYLKGIKMLDVGCGGGILTMPLARLGANITGLDASKELIDIAQNYASKTLKPETTVQFLNSSIEEHSLNNCDSYDVVILSEVLEHISSKEIFINCCVDVLKPGGSIFITTINRTNVAWISAIVLAEYVLSIVPQGNHEWSKLITQEELKDYLNLAGCKILHTSGMTYLPYKNVWIWIPQKSVNYAVHAIKQP